MTAPETQLRAALVKAWAQLRNVEKVQTVETKKYTYDYASLDDCIVATRPVLAEHGLAVVQDIATFEGGRVAISTHLVHEAGGVMVMGPATFHVPADHQQAGAAITYWRRYTLLAALGITAGFDTDGELAAPAPAPAATVDPVKHEEQERAEKAARRQKVAEAQAEAEANDDAPAQQTTLADQVVMLMEARLNGSTTWDDPNRVNWPAYIDDGDKALDVVLDLLDVQDDDEGLRAAFDAVGETSPERLTQLLGDLVQGMPF